MLPALSTRTIPRRRSARSQELEGMADAAHDQARVAERARIEVGAVRIDAPAGAGGVAAQTVRLLVAGDARVQSLPRRVAVVEDPERLRVVIPVAATARRREPALLVTSPAESFGGVAVGTPWIMGPRVGGVSDEEVRRMVSAPFVAMAVGAEALHVTGGALFRRGGAGVRVHEVGGGTHGTQYQERHPGEANRRQTLRARWSAEVA